MSSPDDRTTINSTRNDLITEEGYYRILTIDGKLSHNIVVGWVEDSVQPSGVVSLSYNGDYGLVPGILDLSTQMACRCNVGLPYIDADVTGLPSGAQISIRFG